VSKECPGTGQGTVSGSRQWRRHRPRRADPSNLVDPVTFCFDEQGAPVAQTSAPELSSARLDSDHEATPANAIRVIVDVQTGVSKRVDVVLGGE